MPKKANIESGVIARDCLLRMTFDFDKNHAEMLRRQTKITMSPSFVETLRKAIRSFSIIVKVYLVDGDRIELVRPSKILGQPDERSDPGFRF